ncbi:two-component system, OmpR family, sensor histidine kinase PfeS [Pseudomonas flavescens]|uniref:histidine kinase n=1 Tax=Phytopseudomonas flavescens TaxID=29435 RepID=A0A1G7Y6V8_9GAMM|nr:sensor histidine kinase [Pseudomonas flavescens]SDG92154.1 two-component system, OmpR family, sensor histidine kinase PfeS [Pseudomonas flavescens]
MPGRHSLFWKLVGVLALFFLLLVSLHVDLDRLLVQATSRLSEPARAILTDYAREAEKAWRERGRAGVDDFLRQLREREGVWAVVIDERRHSLSSGVLSEEQSQYLEFNRPIDGSLGRPGGNPPLYVPFSDGKARLVMELPQRLNPRKHLDLWKILLQQVLPATVAILLGALLYHVLMAPLAILRRQANALSSGDLSARVGKQVTRRRDELGELGRTFDQMAGRLESTVTFQRQLLRDLSHELRTPLSRLRVAGENERDDNALRQRLEREVGWMEKLVGDTLELVWLDTERPSLPLESVDIGQLWDLLTENASFEAGWSVTRMPCELPMACRVQGNLNGLAQALENILRNAIRHSPDGGCVRLDGQLEGRTWHLRVSDQGPGVAVHHLQTIFEPFARLDSSRPGDGGFGLGLSIARSAITLQGGRLWAESPPDSGLCMHLLLPVAGPERQMYKM